MGCQVVASKAPTSINRLTSACALCCSVCAHPVLIAAGQIFLTPVHLAIVMEFAAGGDMFEYVIKHKLPEHGQGLREDSARAFFQQLMIALEFCHELGIANRWAMVLIAMVSAWPTGGQTEGALV